MPSGYVRTGRHELAIEGFSRSVLMYPTGEYITSAHFDVGGHRWRIEYYPNGMDTGVQEYISLALILDEADARHDFTATCIFCLAGDAELAKADPMSWTQHTSRSAVAAFVKRVELQGSEHLDKDKFTIWCVIYVEQDRDEALRDMYVGFSLNPYELSGDMVALLKSTENADIELKIEVEGQTVTVAAANLLESQLGADIKFEVGGEIIIAHRRVLSARSPVFAAMLFGYDNAIQFQEQAPGAVVRLEEMEGVVFRMLLHFAYTGSLPPELNTPALPARHPLHIENEGNMSEHLFVAADRYCMERLKLLCAINLCHHLGVNTAARILTLAKQHQSERLKRTCLMFLSIRRHLDAVAATEDMQHLSASCPSLMIDLLDMSVPR